MGFFNRLFGRDNTAVTQRTQNFAELLYGLSSQGNVSKRTVTEDVQAVAIPTVARCLQVVAEGVANLPFMFMRYDGERYKEFTNHELHYLLTVQPNPHMSAYTFKYMIVQQMYHGTGNAYVYPKVDESGQMELVLLDPTAVTLHDHINGTYTINDTKNGVVGTFGENEIIHLFRFSFDGRDGVSVLKYAANTMNIAATGDAETFNRFANGGNLRGFIKNDKTVTGFGEYQDKELKSVATSLDEMMNGGGVHIASLPGSAEFQQMSLNSTDMQFLETRKFTVEELCRIYGVHPAYAFQITSNYKMADLAKTLQTMTINPILFRFENEFGRKLIQRSMLGKRIFKFDTMDLDSYDLATRAEIQMKTIQSGVYSVNDWRRKENKQGIDGGDRVLVSTNLAPIDSAKLTGEQKQG